MAWSIVSSIHATTFEIAPRRVDLLINDFAWQAIHQRVFGGV